MNTLKKNTKKKEVKIPARVVFFDGVCNLCNAAVRFIIRFDKDQSLRFSSLQSPLAKECLKEKHTLDTLVFFEKGSIYTRSTGALKIARYLHLFKYLYFLIYVPKGLRDFVYDLIAKYRYRIFGKKENCPIPNEKIKHLFID
jgi:predicted DCC family thiol-disulfide oxidoreductase YuxK